MGSAVNCGTQSQPGGILGRGATGCDRRACRGQAWGHSWCGCSWSAQPCLRSMPSRAR